LIPNENIICKLDLLIALVQNFASFDNTMVSPCLFKEQSLIIISFGFHLSSGVDRFKEQFAHLEEGDGTSDRNSPHHRKHATSLPR
jgi:hypothetical protein